jgi:hypothetical protein
VILFFENGRLGNQLFQYYGLTKYFPREKLVFFGFEGLERYFNSVDAQFIPKSSLSHWIRFGILRSIVFFFAKVRIIGLITEGLHSDDFILNVRRGLFWNIYVGHNVYFQHPDVFNQIQTTPRLKPYLTEAAHSWLLRKLPNITSSSLVFVHIRRGDYLNWPAKQFPAVLDLAYYMRAMELMQQKIENPTFILMSDDIYYLRDVFTESDTLVISDNSREIDLAIMSLCCSGILSASSFAWWGAFYARSQKKLGSIYLGPKYWGGHRLNKWYPSKFYTDWITYIE